MMKIKPSLITLHIIGWLLFLSLPAVFMISRSGPGNSIPFSAWPLYFLFLSVYIFIFYLHSYLLFPRLYLRKKFIFYFLSILLLMVGIFFLQPFDRMISKQERPPKAKNIMADDRLPAQPGPGSFPPRANGQRKGPAVDIISIALFILVIAISIAIVIEKRWREAIQKAAQAETDKVNAELSFLKAQINPHFLFNTLNNIYSLAISKNENVADAIMRLSNIMRYVTDDVNETYVSLQSELDAVKDYIALQKLRLGKKANVEFDVHGPVGDKKIAPLILLPFVENVFKHGISTAEGSNIIIRLNTSTRDIIFFIQNKLFTTPRVTERAGIGNANTKKRLEHLYPQKYQLDIKAENGLYTVQLVLYI
jgi:two-component system, LytTR family, sensor kinase